MVENVYGKPVSFDGDFYKEENADELPEEIKEMSKEDLDYLESELENIINGKDKTYH